MVEAPNKLLDRARAELHTYDRVGKQTSSELILALFEAERQIAELRADNEHLQHKADQYDSVVKALSVCDGGRYRNDTIESCVLALKARDAAEAENARLRALPLKDEVERVLETLLNKIEIGIDPLDSRSDRRAYDAARDLLSRLRAGEQEGHAPAEIVGLDEYEGEITDPIERAVADRNREARIRAAAPSEQGGDRS